MCIRDSLRGLAELYRCDGGGDRDGRPRFRYAEEIPEKV